MSFFVLPNHNLQVSLELTAETNTQQSISVAIQGITWILHDEKGHNSTLCTNVLQYCSS